jgi:hypothetical protein
MTYQLAPNFKAQHIPRKVRTFILRYSSREQSASRTSR